MVTGLRMRTRRPEGARGVVMVSTKQSEAATLASILTDATGLAFAAWQDGKHAHARHGARTPSDEQGLAFRADVARWHSGPEITVECTGLRQLVRVDGGAGSGWARRAGARLASAVAEAQHSWARNCAAVLEAGCPAVVLEAMLGRDVTYDRRRGPPGQRVEVDDDGELCRVEGEHRPDLSSFEGGDQALVRAGQREVRTPTKRGCSISYWLAMPAARLVAILWRRHTRLAWPPGYAVLRVGDDRDRSLFSARWAGANCLGQTTPKSADDCRADAWADFWAEGRAAAMLPDEVA